MIFIGTQILRRVLGIDTSSCPNCGTIQPLQRIRSRSFLTIYWIPIAPLGRRLEYYQCENCEQSFPIVNHANQDAKLEILATCVLVTAADGTFDPKEIIALLNVCRNLTIALDRESLGQFCSELEQQAFRPITYLRFVRPRWTDEQARLAAQMIFLAASATGEFNDAQSKLLQNLPNLLWMSTEAYTTAIAEVIEPS